MYNNVMFRFFVLLLMISTTIHVKGQVTIGSDLAPERAAVLDIKTKEGPGGTETTTLGGLLLPRVTLTDQNNLTVFGIQPDDQTQKMLHRGLMVYNLGGQGGMDEGVYVWDGGLWQKASPSSSAKTPQFFYMPSIEIEATQQGTFSKNLYTAYKNQFSNPKASSTSVPLPVYANATDLHYYITDYDTNVFSNISVDANGLMTYTVLNAPTDGFAFINIIFVPK